MNTFFFSFHFSDERGKTRNFGQTQGCQLGLTKSSLISPPKVHFLKKKVMFAKF